MARTTNNGSQQNNAVEVLSYAEQVQEEFMQLYMQYDVANAPEKRKNEIIDSFWSDIYKQVFKPDRPQNNNCKSRLLVYDVENVQEVVEMYINLCKRYGGVIKYNQFANLTGIHRDTLYRWHKYNTTGRYIFTLNDTQYKEDSDVIMYINIDNSIVEYKSKDIFDTNIIYNNTNNNMCDSSNNIYNNIKANSNQDRHVLSRRRYDVIKKLQEEMQDSNTNQLSNDTMGAAIRANNEEELGKLYEPKRMIQAEQIKQIATAGQLPVFNKLSGNDTQFITKNE